jgi:hypothetical protein
VKTIHSLSAGILVVALVAGCKRDNQIQTYQAPKDQPAAPVAAPAPPGSMMGADAQSVPINKAPFHWTIPAGWTENPPNGIRLGDVDVPGPGGKPAKIAVTSFPGDVGGILPNFNRWRREIGLPEVSETEITSEKISVDSSEGTLYDLSGAAERTVVAWVMRDGASWFFKLRGPLDVVATAKPAFLDLLKTVHFGGADAAPVASNPHAGMDMGGMGAGMATAPTVSPGNLPQWNVPANWTETPPGMMVTKSYSIPDASGQKAAVSISVLGLTGGGTLANVNRWRRQLKLDEITEATLPQNTQSLDVLGGKATLVDFTGTDAAGQTSEMVAAAVPHGDQTWFYKLTGPPALVSQQKSAFVKFVQEVSYP